MPVIVSDEILAAAHLTEAEALKELALTLFAQERLTLGQAAIVAGVNQLEFQSWLAERKIPIHYGIEDWRDDRETLRKRRESRQSSPISESTPS